VRQQGQSADDLAYLRFENEYRNNLITELPDTDFAFTMVRQMIVSTFEYYLYTALSTSTDTTIAAVAAKSVKEARYHMAHTTDWVIRLGGGTDESNRRSQDAVHLLWSYSEELFETDQTDSLLLDSGIAMSLDEIKLKWQSHIESSLLAATLVLPASSYQHTGSRVGIHTEYLGHILSEMQYLRRTYPDAKW